MKNTVYLNISDISDIAGGRKTMADFCPKPIPRPLKTLVGDELDKPSEAVEIAKGTSLLYNAFKEVAPFISSNKGFRRLRSILSEVKNQDLSNKKGARKIQLGFQTVEGKELLRRFDFQLKPLFYEILNSNFNLEMHNNSIEISKLNPRNSLQFSNNVDTVGITLFKFLVDFENQVVEVKSAERLINRSELTNYNLKLQINDPNMFEGIEIFVLRIQYYQSRYNQLDMLHTNRIARVIGVNCRL